MSPISKSLTFGLVSALACTTAVASAQAQSTAPEIAVAVNKLARNLDPGRQTGNVDVRVYFSIYDTLIKRDFRNAPEVGVKLEPGLATSWSRPDARTLEVTLREAVVCHDGSPFNADDVVFTFSEERLWGAQSFYPRGRNYFSHLESVEKVDDRTVRFVTKAPDLILEERLTSYTSFIVCDEPWMAFQKDGVPFAEWMEAAFDEMKWAPVGTGPFKATGYRKNDFIRLEAHEGYWGGKPAVSAIEFKEVPEVSARIAGVVSGEYKMAVDIPPDQMQVVAGYDNVKSTSVSLDNTHVLVFNQADPVLADKNLRQAMSYAIDRDALRKALWNDENYTPNGHQLASFGAMYSAERAGYTYDPEKARELVKASGYDGSTISFRLIDGYYLNGRDAAQIIQEMWRQVGINAELNFVESFKQVRSEGAQVYAWSNTYRLPDPTGAINVNWGPNAGIQKKYGFFTPPSEFNDIASSLVSIEDQGERRAKFQRMLDIFEDEMPMTMLYNPLVTFIMANDVEWTPYSLYFMDFGPDNFKLSLGQ
ncbi:ABC transporter substrate-binding protein [Pelagibius sp.]|uniref:ABC transporter substrate-binding protein n=1 Tax=Pelagibius sp. TaxID=1931238 RepID=UPI003B508108